MPENFNHRNRRQFLAQMAALRLAGSAAPWAASLAAMGDAAAAGAQSDYRALVCIFLYGGNDHGNTIIPYDSGSYSEYSRIRGPLAIRREKLGGPLIPLQANDSFGNRQVALAPGLARLKTLFTSGKLGIQLNVGPLEQPTTIDEFFSKSVPLPPKLFSHNDQQSIWQASMPEGATSGWGGRIADRFLQLNGAGSTFSCTNTSGNAVFSSGGTTIQYQISPSGAVKINPLNSVYDSRACGQLLTELITSPRNHKMESLHSEVTARSISSERIVSDALAAAPPIRTPFGSSTLDTQLKMVARLISCREALNVKRQVFFVSMSGFDLHNDLVNLHTPLLETLASGISSFYSATEELGVSKEVTTFTASDFGRTLSSNGDGSDHGWGGHHFILGGAVKGGRYWGKLPSTSLNGPEDVGQGRLLPTTSVDQLAATLAKWMGVEASEIPLVVPRIDKYPSRDLGYFL